MNLIIPAAGKSTRFPGLKPKWMLTHPNGNIMVTEGIRELNLEKIESIFLVILREHVEKYKCVEGIKKAFSDIGVSDTLKIVILNEETRNQPETVARAIEMEQISGPIFIKDTDSGFKCIVEPGNAVAIYDLNKMSRVNDPANKSYVMLDDNGLVSNIVEKQIISPLFCVGGYSFARSEEYMETFYKLKEHENLYVSHIIYQMILEGNVFQPIFVNSYRDWGTLHDWNQYKSRYSTIFIDLDGTLLKNSGEYFEPKWGETSAIRENVDAVNALYDSGRVKIIIMTSRREAYRDLTLQQLKREDIKYHDIIFDLFHGKRIIINDYADSNPYKSCDAINIKRDSDELKRMLQDSLGFDIS
ncbi:MAG: hypothetical protein Q8P39_03470 [Candidatus Yanofskybacteria bacterium]|nr:hypothetical protein [Candidatus Yanofskybacteria bacterium]